MQSITSKIYKIMLSQSMGKVFIYEDFFHIAKYETIRKSFSDLEKENKLTKILPGIYHAPRHIKEIDKYSIPTMDEVILALSKKFKWIITPNDEAVLNYTGLSTQVPAKYLFYSTGPSKTFKVNNQKLIFKHKIDKDTINLPDKQAYVIRSIKIIGHDNLNEDQFKILRKLLNDNEKKSLLKNSKELSTWIRKEIENIYNV